MHSVGFGATRVAMRTAPAPEGLWTPPCEAFTPPESLATLASDMSLYFPRFVR